MSGVAETLTAMICVLGLTALGWWLLGRLLCPLPCGGCFILLCGRGDGNGLEQSVRGFMWLRGLGLVRAPVLIADAGLSTEGRSLALELAKRWPGVILWPTDDLCDYIKYYQ